MAEVGCVTVSGAGCAASSQEETYGKSVVLADREMVESTAETDILGPAATENVAMLVVGDPLWCVHRLLACSCCYFSCVLCVCCVVLCCVV